jgi:NAD(P)-dependent dehydrogenase (short-subunit alcohol dehydrogenase family)
MAQRLAGRVAVITGAGSGIGAAMAALFVREGANVVLADISGQQEEVAQRLGSSAIGVRADVSKGGDVRAMLQVAIDKFGRLDILCNNAGIDGPMAPTGEYREEDFDRVIAVNLTAVFLGMRYAIPLMLASGGGSIVNTASMAAVVAFPTMPAYCAAKGGVVMLTKTAAVDYASQGIRVNAVLPGVIATGMTRSMPAHYIEAVKKVTPMNRMAEPSEVANLALFLASDESSFITGTAMTVDGGYTSL